MRTVLEHFLCYNGGKNCVSQELQFLGTGIKPILDLECTSCKSLTEQVLVFEFVRENRLNRFDRFRSWDAQEIHISGQFLAPRLNVETIIPVYFPHLRVEVIYFRPILTIQHTVVHKGVVVVLDGKQVLHLVGSTPIQVLVVLDTVELWFRPCAVLRPGFLVALCFALKQILNHKKSS